MFDTETARLLIEPTITFFGSLMLAGTSTTVAVQLLKLNWFPLAVSKFPRFTNVCVSVISSLVAIYVSGINLVLTTFLDYIAFMVGVMIFSAFTYKTMLKGTTNKDGQSVEKLE